MDNVLKFVYDTAYFPPMPILEISFSAPEQSLAVGPLRAIIDTGADGTMIPLHYLLRIEAIMLDEAYVRSQWGERLPVQIYMVDLRIGSWTLPSVDVIGYELGDEIVVGRNVLNKLRILLNGPARLLELRI